MSRITIRQRGITSIAADAVVNAANEHLWEGGGVCGAIFQAAGQDRLTQACRKIRRCDTGSAVVTPAFDMNAKIIIHAVGPIYYNGNCNESVMLYSAYHSALGCCKENDCHSVVFPLISSGIFGYPKVEAWKIALTACRDFIVQNNDYELDIIFAIPDPSIAQIGQELLPKMNRSVEMQ